MGAQLRPGSLIEKALNQGQEDQVRRGFDKQAGFIKTSEVSQGGCLIEDRGAYFKNALKRYRGG